MESHPEQHQRARLPRACQRTEMHRAFNIEQIASRSQRYTLAAGVASVSKDMSAWVGGNSGRGVALAASMHLL